jgi:hypothetical protein
LDICKLLFYTPLCCCCPVDEQQHANHAAISRLRTMVASLKEGVAFCKRLAASLRQVQVLLISPKADVVHDAIVFLTLCKWVTHSVGQGCDM